MSTGNTELKAAVIETAEELPRELRFAVTEATIERDRGRIAESRKVATALADLRDGYKADLVALLAEDAGRYRAFQLRKREREGDIQNLYTATPEGEIYKRGLRRRSLDDSREFLSSLRIDRNSVKRMQQDYIGRARAAIEAGMHAQATVPYVLVSPAEAPKLTNNPWTWFSPPYLNQWRSATWDGSGGTRWVVTSENRVAGEIGVQSSMSLHGADDSDYSYTNAQSELWVPYRMPAAGLIEAWAELQSIDNRYGGCLDDEFGFSDASIQQLSRSYMQVASPGWGALRYGTLTDYRRGESDGCWSGSICNVVAGSIKWIQLFSADSYAANQWVTVAVGVHDYNYFWVNDMSCDAAMTNRWFIRRIAMRSTGAP